MALVPFQYNLRSLFARGGGTLLTMLSIAATVAVLAGVLCLQQGFQATMVNNGRDDLAVFLRPSANSEGESAVDRARQQILCKELPEIAQDEHGQPLAGAELFLAVSLEKTDGGKTNVPIRGVQPASFAVHGDSVRLVEGRRCTPGSDELIVGKALGDRIRNCHVDDVLVLNVTPFRIVGIFEGPGAYRGEIWGDLERLQAALQRAEASRVLARLRPGATAAALDARLHDDPRTPAKVQTEREYLAAQTGMLSGLLGFVCVFLGAIMGLGAVFTGTNAMLASIGSRTHEIGILLATGFRPWAIFLSFLGEAVLIGLLGGVLGCLCVLPLDGLQTGTTNMATFTEFAFAFRFTPTVLFAAAGCALLLGVFGGAYPALRAALLRPTEALRRA